MNKKSLVIILVFMLTVKNRSKNVFLGYGISLKLKKILQIYLLKDLF